MLLETRDGGSKAGGNGQMIEGHNAKVTPTRRRVVQAVYLKTSGICLKGNMP